jgi:hypothetical protein
LPTAWDPEEGTMVVQQEPLAQPCSLHSKHSSTQSSTNTLSSTFAPISRTYHRIVRTDREHIRERRSQSKFLYCSRSLSILHAVSIVHHACSYLFMAKNLFSADKWLSVYTNQPDHRSLRRLILQPFNHRSIIGACVPASFYHR